MNFIKKLFGSRKTQPKIMAFVIWQIAQYIQTK